MVRSSSQRDDNAKQSPAIAEQKRSAKRSCLLLLVTFLGLVIVATVLYAMGFLKFLEFGRNAASPPPQSSSGEGTLQMPDPPTSLPAIAPTREPVTIPINPPDSDSKEVTPLVETPAPSRPATETPTASQTLTPTASWTSTLDRLIMNMTGNSSSLDPDSPAPTLAPTTQSPTVTASPTAALVQYDTNRVPKNPSPGYFNYDDSTPYGPSRWNQVDTQDHFLREFDRDGFGAFQGHLAGKEPIQNRCGGPDRNQSPKNLVRSAQCESHHEIRTKCGQEMLWDATYTKKLILPHKLSLVFNRRPCLDTDDETCDEGRPPIADYPDYSATTTPWSDLLNLDIKVPGEHTLEGEVFDAELQMLHTHLQPEPSRVSSIGIPIRATSDGYNVDFQIVLNEFKIEYISHQHRCRRRRLRSAAGSGNTIPADMQPNFWNETFASDTARQLQSRFFDPYSYALMPGIHFYRYDGSMTEPPCMRLTWWVMSKPMIISRDQLEELREILFTNVDAETCQGTSVHNANQEVTRPIQPLGDDRVIEKCDETDFDTDLSKGAGEARRC